MAEQKNQADKVRAAAKERGADPGVKRPKKTVGQLATAPRPHKPTGLTPSKVRKPKKPENQS
jgi:hypothetical protein